MQASYRVLITALLILGLHLTLPACDRSQEEGDQTSKIEGTGEIVATYAGGEFTLEEFKLEADGLPDQVKPILTSPERRKQYLENLIIGRLLIADAKKRGLDKDEEIRRQVEETENRLLLQKVYRDLQNAVSVTDEDVAAYYEANKDEFSTAEVRASHILVQDPARAEDLLKQLREKPEDFARLAKENSADTATAVKGGDLGTFGRGRMVPDFEKAAFALNEPGDLSEVVKSPFGYHIIMLTEKTQGDVKPLEQVKEQIRLSLLQKLQRQSLEERIEKLKAENQIRINENVLARYAPTQPEGLPPVTAAPGGEESGDTPAGDEAEAPEAGQAEEE